MEEFSRELPDLSGAAVRGEAPNLTEAELDAMPKRAAFIAWAKDRSLDTTETKHAWGQRAFLHDHIETMWIGWFNTPVSACAADAPSEPSDYDKAFVRAESGRAADALDSQPTEWNDAINAATGLLEQMGDSLGDHADYNHCEMTCCDSTRMHALSDAASAVFGLARASSQPTDGGVRNG